MKTILVRGGGRERESRAWERTIVNIITKSHFKFFDKCIARCVLPPPNFLPDIIAPLQVTVIHQRLVLNKHKPNVRPHCGTGLITNDQVTTHIVLDCMKMKKASCPISDRTSQMSDYKKNEKI